ncbi:hypothetical protein BC826DRAFT_1106025 [Russula brevipes]|nr:hypothetical protein BC826DRAFT_1106025 [Russula brevipes]
MTLARTLSTLCDDAGAGRSGVVAYSQSTALWNEGHATLLATKWYDHKKLAELGESEGLVYKKGPFSATEEQSIKSAIEQYRVEHALTEDDMYNLIFTKQKGSTFWQDVAPVGVARSVPMRPIKNVFVHVRRAWERTVNQGRWAGHEDEGLERAIRELGHSWDAISKRLGRSPANCRDRYRNHLAHRSAWSPEEVQELTAIVRSMISQQGGNASGISWADIAARMGHKRNGQQCRNKWYNMFPSSHLNIYENDIPRLLLLTSLRVQSLHGRDEHSRLDWYTVDTFIFMHKVTSLSVLDESEIIWSKFPDPGWNRWSSYQLRRKWRALKRSVPGHENMAPREIAQAVLQLQQQSAAEPCN